MGGGTMSAAMLRSNGDPSFWVGALSMAVGSFLTRQQDEVDLRLTYEDFLESEACSDDLRAVIPPLVTRNGKDHA